MVESFGLLKMRSAPCKIFFSGERHFLSFTVMRISMGTDCKILVHGQMEAANIWCDHWREIDRPTVVLLLLSLQITLSYVLFMPLPDSLHFYFTPTPTSDETFLLLYVRPNIYFPFIQHWRRWKRQAYTQMKSVNLCWIDLRTSLPWLETTSGRWSWEMLIDVWKVVLNSRVTSNQMMRLQRKNCDNLLVITKFSCKMRYIKK